MKFNRLALRVAAVSIVAATVVAAGTLGATAIRGRVESSKARVAPHANAQVTTANVEAPVTRAAPSVTTSDSANVILAGAPAPTATSAKAKPVVPFSPVLPLGDSMLHEGVTAVRTDSDVVVAFDVPMARTRVPERFESLVRRTLPEVYGPVVEGLLKSVPEGAIASQGDLFRDLPRSGARIAVNAAWAIRVYPQAREGRDGPLVIRYRAVLAPLSE